MQFWKWPHYPRERKPRHLRVDGSSGPETPLGCMALMQTTSPQGERGALGPESPLGRIMQQSKRNLISLIYTLTRANELPTGSLYLGGNPSPSHQISPALSQKAGLLQEHGHHFSLAHSTIKRKISRPGGEKSVRTSPPTLPPNPHTRSKIIPL